MSDELKTNKRPGVAGYNKRQQPIVGAGLVLSRYRGERIFITANPNASDAEILDSLRNEGIILTLVDINEHRSPNSRTGARVAKIGIRASNHLSIAREEIINRDQPKQGDQDGHLQPQGESQKS